MCIFCQIISGTIPAYKIYEDEKSLAFLDIKPIHPGHILVISKKHVANLEEIKEEDLQAVMITVKKMGKLIKEKLNYEGYNILLNNDPVANQEIYHLHFHLIPRVEGDALNSWPSGKYNEGEAEEILNKFKL